MLIFTCNEPGCSATAYKEGLCRFDYVLSERIRAKKRVRLANRLKPTKRDRTLRRSPHKTEVHLQCEVYHQLKLLGVEMLPEYRDNRNRYDGLVVLGATPVCILQIKKDGQQVTEDQENKYEGNSFRVPVIYILGEAEIADALVKVQELVEKAAETTPQLL